MSNETSESNRRERKAWVAVRKNWKSLSIVAAAAGALAVLALALPAKTRDVQATVPPPINVEVEVVQPLGEVADTFILHGLVEPNHVVMVASEVSGQIEGIGRRKSSVTMYGRTFPAGQEVAEGECVTKGDPLVHLASALPQAEYDRAKAQADYDAREFARIEQLFAKNVATKAELDQTNTRMEVSRAALALTKERLDRATIYAPITGVLDKLEEVGQFVQPGAFIAQIVDMSVAKVVAEVSERDVHYLKVNDAAEILIDPLPGSRAAGQITFISELADQSTRTTRVEISALNEQRLLRSGQSVRVRLTRQVLKDLVMIPLGATIPLENGKLVYVVEGDAASQREVELDLDFIKGTRVRVLSGLVAGDRLITSGHRYVGPGQKVRVMDSRQATTSPDGSQGK